MLKMFTIPPGTLLGFKALPIPPFSLPSTPSQHLSKEWEALYPQLSFKCALAYLPNQWDRGCQRAHISALTTKRAMRVLLSTEAMFGSVGVSSSDKADRVRELYESHREEFGLAPLAMDAPLMAALGQHELALCIPDSENLELVVPHCMTFAQGWLEMHTLYEFEQSVEVPFTIGRVVGVDGLRKNELVNLEHLDRILGARLEEGEATVVLGLIQHATEL